LPVHRWPEAPERDHFDGDKLDPRWVYLRSPRTDSYDLKARPSVLRLWGTSETLFDVASPTFVGRRPQHLEFVATAAVEFDPQSPNEEAGLTLLMTNEHHYDFLIKQDGEQRKLLVQAHLELMHHTEISIPLMPGPVRLRITGRREHYAFSVAQGGEFREVARLNTRYLATEVTGGYTGVVIGLYATGNGRSCTSPADVDWFEYHPVA
jgi:alpha-N-arabinofuranosidase